MRMRRYTRLTNALSKKVYNHSCAAALLLFHYNYARVHMTLTRLTGGTPTTPAMAAGLATRPWTMADIVRFVEAPEGSAKDIGGASTARKQNDQIPIRDRNIGKQSILFYIRQKKMGRRRFARVPRCGGTCRQLGCPRP